MNSTIWHIEQWTDDLMSNAASAAFVGQLQAFHFAVAIAIAWWYTRLYITSSASVVATKFRVWVEQRMCWGSRIPATATTGLFSRMSEVAYFQKYRHSGWRYPSFWILATMHFQCNRCVVIRSPNVSINFSDDRSNSRATVFRNSWWR